MLNPSSVPGELFKGITSVGNVGLTMLFKATEPTSKIYLVVILAGCKLADDVGDISHVGSFLGNISCRLGGSRSDLVISRDIDVSGWLCLIFSRLLLYWLLLNLLWLCSEACFT